jgi:hypothetical protein
MRVPVWQLEGSGSGSGSESKIDLFVASIINTRYVDL